MRTRPPADLGARIARLHEDVERCARVAGLSYVDEARLSGPGIRRLRRGTGFSYRDAGGRPLRDPLTKQRIAALAIPPAWKNVWICPEATGHILAIGEDDRGRTQYLYHDQWRELRDVLNSYRLIAFAEQLPTIREHVAGQLRRRTFDRDRVLAAMVRILDLSAIRVGNEIYAEENESFGLSTLARRHAMVRGATVALSFPAKSGKHADIVIRDAEVARVVTRLLDQRTRRLFTVDKKVIDSDEVNRALQTWTGAHVTAKDFRTWNGTRTAFAYLERHADDADRDHAVLDAIDAAAAHLGNTRTVARAHYVHPHLISTFVDGRFPRYLAAAGRSRRSPSLDAVERRLVAFLHVAWQREGLTGARPRALSA